MIISLILAADEQNGIGKDNKLLCHLPADLRFFKESTMGHHMVMGRLTFESVGRLLPGRVSIIISRNPDYKVEGAVMKQSLEAAIAYAREQGETELFITGGGHVYKEALSIADRVYLTRIHHSFEADTFFPNLDSGWELASAERREADEKNQYACTFMRWERKRTA